MPSAARASMIGSAPYTKNLRWKSGYFEAASLQKKGRGPLGGELFVVRSLTHGEQKNHPEFHEGRDLVALGAKVDEYEWLCCEETDFQRHEWLY